MDQHGPGLKRRVSTSVYEKYLIVAAMYFRKALFYNTIHPETFGTGAIEGVAGPETANNAATAAGFVPLFTLGIPTNSVLALMLAAMMLHGVTPGPLLLIKWSDVFWGVIASMYLGNVMLRVLNLPMIGLFVRILKGPYGILSPLIIMFGLRGYLMKRFDIEPAPLLAYQ